MTRIILLSLLLALAVPAVVAPATAAAADGKILDATIDRYMQEASKWEPRIKQAARTMFWILATISMVFTFAYMFIRGNATLGDFFGEFLKFSVTTGFFLWLLENGSAIAKAIITSFGQLGREASSTYQEELSPSNLLGFALDLIVRACGSFGEQDIATSVIALLLSIAIAVLFAIIAAMMVQLLCSAWVLVYAGVIYLGFGGGRWTSDMAVNYFKTVLGLAMQTFTFCLLVGIGQGQIERLIAESTQMKTVEVKGYVYDSTVSTTAMTITEACIILVFTVVLFMLVKTVPQLVAGVVNGSSVGGIHLGGSGSAMASAAAVGGAIATGGAMVAAQAAGVGLALNSAYQQSQTNMAEGMGKFAGASFSGGLAGAMDRGLTFASDMVANMATGVKDAAGDSIQQVKENLQRSTIGGHVSANIDANNATNMAEKHAEGNEPGNTPSSGGNSDRGGGSAAAAGNADGNAGGAFDGGGSISGASAPQPPPLPDLPDSK